MNNKYIQRRKKSIKEDAEFIVSRLEEEKKRLPKGEWGIHIFPYEEEVFEEHGRHIKMSLRKYVIEVSKTIKSLYSIESEVIWNFGDYLLVCKYFGTKP